MKVHIVDTGFFKLDGGAMFGIVPRQLWKKLNPPDEKNLCTWAMRCLLIETADRRILVDTGIGDKQGEKFRSHFEPHGEASLTSSLDSLGYRPEDITDVLLTHLHFDHAGGAVISDDQGRLRPAFPAATYWTNEVHYQWALHPNQKERASFLKENFVPLEEAECLQFIELPENGDEVAWLPGIRLRFVYGHTEAMMVPILGEGKQKMIYCADVIPSSHHVSMPYVMAYDVRPLLTLREKGRILEEAVKERHLLFFEHDPQIACGYVGRNDRGRILLQGKADIAELFPQ